MAVLTHVADDFWQTTTKITVESRGGGSLMRRVENACHVNFHMVLLLLNAVVDP